MRQRVGGRRRAAIEVAGDRFIQFRFARQCGAVCRQPPAQRAHHAADMLADDDVANPFLPQLAVHVVHEQFGQPDAFLRSAQRLQPHQRLGEDGDDHVETPVHRVGNPPLHIPMGPAALRDDGVVEGAHRVLGIARREQALEDAGHDE
ncbi:hypothetical protein AI27_14230 [Sphingomonas sp. BHC-A]|nr:hypothetical protein AI27_14230 [Sphingomonas sp. BHC-A]